MAEHFVYTRKWEGDVTWRQDAIDSFRFNSHSCQERFATADSRFVIGMRDISSTSSQTDATNVFREVGAVV